MPLSKFIGTCFLFISPLFMALPANAQDIGIKFNEMKIGTTLITQYRDGKKRRLAEKFVGKHGAFFVTERSMSNDAGTMKYLSSNFFDSKGRLVKNVHKGNEDFYEDYSCHYVLGDCSHIHDYHNPFTKKKSKRTRSPSRYKNRLEGDTLILGAVIFDGSINEFPFKLGPYNLRVSSEYKNALGQTRGFKLIEIIEPPTPSLSAAPAKKKPLEVAETKPAGENKKTSCETIYAKLKVEAPGDVSICETPVKAPKLSTCKPPSSFSATRPSSHVVLVLDASGSMAGRIGGKTKMATAKREATRFLTELEKDVPVGLVIYGHKGTNEESGKAESCAGVEWAQKVSLIPGRIEKSIKTLKPAGWTPLAGTLDYLKSELVKLRKNPKNKDAIPVVYVISDGKETCGGDPVASAKALHESGVQAAVNIIGFDVDEKTRAELEAISAAGGGKYFPARDSKALSKQLNAARESEASLARYHYCLNFNEGLVHMAHHNASIGMTGCFVRERDRKRLNFIKKRVKAFTLPEEIACAAEVNHMAYVDSVVDGKWLIKTSKRMRAEREADVEAYNARARHKPKE